jgi:hypothetical protein
VIKMMQRYGRGWFNEQYRHSLAAKGIKTSFARPSNLPMRFVRPSAFQTAMIKRPEELGTWVAITDQSLNQMVARSKFDPSPEIEESLLQLKKDIETFRFDNKELYNRLTKRIALIEGQRKEFYAAMTQPERDALYFMLTNRPKANVSPIELQDTMKRYPEIKARALVAGATEITPVALEGATLPFQKYGALQEQKAVGKIEVGEKERKKREIKPLVEVAAGEKQKILDEIEKRVWILEKYKELGPAGEIIGAEAKSLAATYKMLYGDLPEELAEAVK